MSLSMSLLSWTPFLQKKTKRWHTLNFSFWSSRLEFVMFFNEDKHPRKSVVQGVYIYKEASNQFEETKATAKCSLLVALRKGEVSREIDRKLAWIVCTLKIEIKTGSKYWPKWDSILSEFLHFPTEGWEDRYRHLSSHAKIMGKGSTNHSHPALFFYVVFCLI